MPPRRAGGRAGAVQPTRATSMTTRSRAQAGPSATAQTPPQPGPPTTIGTAVANDDEPLPVYPGPAQPSTGNNPPTGEAPGYPSSPRLVPIPTTPPAPPDNHQFHPIVISALREIAASQTELSRSISRTQQEMMELRSVINSGRSSRASSHRSTRSRRVEVEGERPRIESTGLSDTETPGLESVTESDTEQEDWYEPANCSRSAPVNHEDPNPRAVESASAAFNR